MMHFYYDENRLHLSDTKQHKNPTQVDKTYYDRYCKKINMYP